MSTDLSGTASPDPTAVSDADPPDARDALAAERTGLSWARLSVALSLITIALAAWSPASVPPAVTTLLGVLTGLGALAAAVRSRTVAA